MYKIERESLYDVIKNSCKFTLYKHVLKVWSNVPQSLFKITVEKFSVPVDGKYPILSILHLSNATKNSGQLCETHLFFY